MILLYLHLGTYAVHLDWDWNCLLLGVHWGRHPLWDVGIYLGPLNIQIDPSLEDGPMRLHLGGPILTR